MQTDKDMEKTFIYRVISVQPWNNNKTQLLSQHKTLSAALRMVSDCEKRGNGNKYHIEEI
jgi:hypothetical protein